MNEENFDIFDANLDDVADMPEFGAAISGQYELTVEDIKVELDKKNRVVATIRESITNTDGVQTVPTGAVPGNIFNRLYFHTPKTLGFIKMFVEGHGGVWSDFSTQLKAGKGQDLVTVLTSLFDSYVGTKSNAKVDLVLTDQHGVALKRAKNEINRYIVTKQAA